MEHKKMIVLVALIMMSAGSLYAKEKTEKFEVKGNCEMCERRIEGAAISVKGVTKVNWDKETKMAEISFNDSQTNIHQIQMAIAKAGHDTPMHKASDEAYNKLPDCCHYDRTGKTEQNRLHGSGTHE
ncbi:MAG: heavy-metal-associated domain-containing protein [Mangrovibacterium sp.]